MDIVIAIGLLIPPVVLSIMGWRVVRKKEREIARLRGRMMTYAERVREKTERMQGRLTEYTGRIERIQGRNECIEREEREIMMSPPEIRVSGHGGNSPIVDTRHKRAEILIPENLTEEEKQVVRDFYNL